MKTYLIAASDDGAKTSYVKGLYMGFFLQGPIEIPVAVFDVSESHIVHQPHDPFVTALPAGQLEFEGTFSEMLLEFWRRATTDPGAAVFVEIVLQRAFPADRQETVRDTLDSIRAHLGLPSDEAEFFRGVELGIVDVGTE